MYVLFECGNCSNVYQVQIEKISNKLQKVICTSCQNTQYFGALPQNKGLKNPSIEKITSTPTQPPVSKNSIDDTNLTQNILWKCGICESEYDLPLNRITSDGIKITCNNCFNFFILQRVGAIVDLDHMVVQDSRTDQKKKKTSPSKDLPPVVDIDEVSAKFRINIQNQTPEEEVKLVTFPLPPKKTKAKLQTRPSNVEEDMILSFHSFQVQKGSFKLNTQNLEHSVTFNENHLLRKKNFLEKNMISISIGVIVVTLSSFAIAAVYAFKHKKLGASVEEQVTTPPDQNSDKPRYGFPQLGE